MIVNYCQGRSNPAAGRSHSTLVGMTRDREDLLPTTPDLGSRRYETADTRLTGVCPSPAGEGNDEPALPFVVTLGTGTIRLGSRKRGLPTAERVWTLIVFALYFVGPHPYLRLRVERDVEHGWSPGWSHGVG